MTIYIVTGPPGSGKSTVCDSLAKHFDRGLHLHCDDLYNMVKGGHRAPWDDSDDFLKDLMFEASNKLISTYSEADFDIVVDYVFSLAQLQKFISNITDPIVLCVLLPSLEKNVERDKNRQWVIGESRVSKYHKEFSELKILQPFVIDTTSIDPERIVEDILCMKPSDSFELKNRLQT